MNAFKNFLFNSIEKLDDWITRINWKAYDPFNRFSADRLSLLTRNNHYLRIALQQIVRRFPLNLRPLIGIKKETSSKEMDFCELCHTKLHKAKK